jgi:probable HAF family extracellular repeat protein
MKSKIFRFTTALSLLAALGVPVQLAAQEQQDKKEHHHYKLVDIGTLGGPTSFLSGPSLQTVNNRGAFAAIANTSTPNPNPNCFIPFNNPDCFVEHPVVWRDGTLTDLGVLPGGANSQTNWINANGLIAGFSDNGLIDPLTGLPEGIAVLWAGGKIINLGTLPGGTESLAGAVNSRGQVVGFSNNDIPDPYSMVGLVTQTRAFLWRDGVIKDLGTLGGPDAVTNLVNERGQIAGNSYINSTPNQATGVPTQDPFFWEDGRMVDIGTFGGTVGSANGLNNRGQVVGGSNTAGDSGTDAFLWSKSEGMKDLGTLGGTNTDANWINDAGEVVGSSTTLNNQTAHAFLWRDGVMTDLGTPGSDPGSEALSINARGQVVGQSLDCCGNALHGFLWEHGGPIVDLNALVPPGSDVTVVKGFDINDRGEITGLGVLPNGDTRAVLLIPCDEKHPNIEGCDYSLVDANTVLPAPRTGPSLTQRAPQSRWSNRYHIPGRGTGPTN